MTGLIFITREKFSRAVESLTSIASQIDVQSPIVITDIGYPAEVRAKLESILRYHKRVSWVHFDHYNLPNAQLNAAVAQYTSDGPVVVTENDVVFAEDAVGHMTAPISAVSAEIVSPLIMHQDTGHAHYDPPVSVILHDESDGSFTSFVERIPRNGWLPLVGTRTVFHIERHAFAASAESLRQIVPLNDQINTREQIEFSMLAFEVQARMLFVPDAVVRYYAPPPIEEMDRELFAWRWDEQRAAASNDYVQQRWNLRHFARSTNFVRRMNEALSDGN